MDEVRRLSGAFVGADPAPVDDGASQPLLRRQSTRQEGRLQFQAEQQQAAQNAVLSLSWAFMMFHMVLINLIFFVFYVELKSWYILFVYGGALQESEMQTPSFFMRLILVVWLLLGQHWTDAARTCPSTSPDLFIWCDFLVDLGVLLILLSFTFRVLVLLFILGYIWMIERGHFRSPQAAREDTLDSLHKVQYDPLLFADDAVPGDTRPQGECCCCMENFSHEKDIVRTPCQHYFHKACLGDWLKLARTCPLCRCDLDQATLGEQPKEVVQDGPRDQNAAAADAV